MAHTQNERVERRAQWKKTTAASTSQLQQKLNEETRAEEQTLHENSHAHTYTSYVFVSFISPNDVYNAH